MNRAIVKLSRFVNSCYSSCCNGVKNGKLKSFTGNFEYFTSSNISSYGSPFDLEAVPVEESELLKKLD